MSTEGEKLVPPDVIFEAVHKGDAAGVKQALSNGSDPNMRDSNLHGARPLILACFQGNKETIAALLEGNADPNLTDDHGGSPLLITAGVGNIAAMELLLGGGADVNVRDPQGATCLHTAAFFGAKPIVDVLLKYKADTEIVDKDSKTALILCTQNLKGIPPPPPPPEGAEGEVPEHMKDMPPPPGHPDFDEKTFAEWVEKMEKEHGKGKGGKGGAGKGEGEGGKGKGGPPPEPQWRAVLEALLESGAKAQVADGQGMSPLMLSCDMGEPEVAELVRHGLPGG